MNNKFFRNGLVVGVIFLFFGIAVQPITSINNEQIKKVKSNNNINYYYNEEDCNCKDVDIQDLDRVNCLLDDIEVKIKNIELKYGHISDIKLKCDEILDILKKLDENHGPICSILYNISKQIDKLETYYEDGWHHYWNKYLKTHNQTDFWFSRIYMMIYMFIMITCYDPVFYSGLLLHCWWCWPVPPPPLKQNIIKKIIISSGFMNPAKEPYDIKI